MKHARKKWGIITILSAVGVGTILHTHEIQAQEAQIFRSTVQSLKASTSIPLRLPSQLPASVTNQHIYLRSHADVNGYDVSLESHPQCKGANACYIGSIHASRGEKPYIDERTEKVQLTNGIAGFYHPLLCGGSCTPSTIEWSEKGVLYSIQMRVTRDKTVAKREMIQLAKLSIPKANH
jgi:hypothetical protein